MTGHLPAWDDHYATASPFDLPGSPFRYVDPPLPDGYHDAAYDCVGEGVPVAGRCESCEAALLDHDDDSPQNYTYAGPPDDPAEIYLCLKCAREDS